MLLWLGRRRRLDDRGPPREVPPDGRPTSNRGANSKNNEAGFHVSIAVEAGRALDTHWWVFFGPRRRLF
jgi:hypothetical protein